MLGSKVIKGSFQSSQVYLLKLHILNVMLKVIHLAIRGIGLALENRKVPLNGLTSEVLTQDPIRMTCQISHKEGILPKFGVH